MRKNLTVKSKTKAIAWITVLYFFSFDIKICTFKSLSNFWGTYQNIVETFFKTFYYAKRLPLTLSFLWLVAYGLPQNSKWRQ